jgi:aromatic-L-amino-acid decarboxylase
VQMIGENIRLAHELFAQIPHHSELQAFTQALSITTFRYVPADLDRNDSKAQEYLDKLNRELLSRLQNGGEAYVSNAVIDGKFVLRACIVNFRTSQADIEALPPLVMRLGKSIDAELRPREQLTNND